MASGSTPLPDWMAQRFPVLIIADAASDTAVARSAGAVVACLEEAGVQVVVSRSLEDGQTALTADPGYSCIIVGWDLCKDNTELALEVMRLAHRRCAGLPIMLGMSQGSRSQLPLEVI